MRRIPLAVCATLLSIGVLVQPATASANTTFRGTWLCNWQINGDYLPMAGARVELLTPYVDLDEYDIPGNFRVVGVTHTDADGNWSFTFPSDDEGDDYWVRVLTNGNGVRMHDFLIPWPFFVDSDRNQNDVALHDYGRLVIHTYRCEVWTGLQRAYDDYVATIGGKPPYGDLDVVSHMITAGTPLTMFTEIWWPADKPVGPDPAGVVAHGSGPAFGLETAFHEFGHSFRHAFDAPNPGIPKIDLARAHFFSDVVYWNYAQKHDACKKTNSGFAFNEGWASYWAGYRSDGKPPDCKPNGQTDYSIEGNVTAALQRLQSLCGLSRAQMVEVLRSRSGQLLPTSPIHTFDQFKAAAEARFSSSGSCLLDRITYPPGTAPREALSRTPSIGSVLRKAKSQMNQVLGAARGELTRARRGLRSTAPCRPGSCLDRLEAAIRMPLATGKLAIAKQLKRSTTKWSPRERRVLNGPPSSRYLKLVAKRESGLRRRVKSVSKQMFRAMLKKAKPLARRDGSARAKAITKFLGRSLRRASAGRLPVGLIPPVGQGSTQDIGPAPLPPSPTTPGTTALPDLVVDSITGLQTSNDPHLKVTVRNAGNAAAAGSQVVVVMHRSTDGASLQHAPINVPPLAPGASATVDTSICNPYAADSATATADSAGVIPESNDVNNTLTVTGTYCRYP